MAFRLILGLIIPLFFSATLWADELKINPNHPNQYTVVKGDTLWDISGKFLEHPWRWPELWHNNPQIKDPHWIYPGDTLYFSYVNGVPTLSLSPEGSSEVTLVPRVRESPIEQAIQVIPPDKIAQFLTSPRVVSEGELNNAAYILEIAGERLVGSAGDRIYVRGIDQPTSLEYRIFRPGAPYISPETQEILGYEAKYVGDAMLEASGDPSTLLVNKSTEQLRRGDRLMAGNEKGLALNYFPRPPETPISGHIIRNMSGMNQIGQYDVVVLDKGTADGLEPGHTLDVYRAGRIVADPYRAEKAVAVKLPDELAGVLIVFRPFERVSYALVMKAEGAIHTMDRVQTP